MAPVESTATRVSAPLSNWPTPGPGLPAWQVSESAASQVSKPVVVSGEAVTSKPKERTKAPADVYSLTRWLPGSATIRLPALGAVAGACLLYTSPSPRDG